MVWIRSWATCCSYGSLWAHKPENLCPLAVTMRVLLRPAIHIFQQMLAHASCHHLGSCARVLGYVPVLTLRCTDHISQMPFMACKASCLLPDTLGSSGAPPCCTLGPYTHQAPHHRSLPQLFSSPRWKRSFFTVFRSLLQSHHIQGDCAAYARQVDGCPPPSQTFLPFL